MQLPNSLGISKPDHEATDSLAGLSANQVPAQSYTCLLHCQVAIGLKLLHEATYEEGLAKLRTCPSLK